MSRQRRRSLLKRTRFSGLSDDPTGPTEGPAKEATDAEVSPTEHDLGLSLVGSRVGVWLITDVIHSLPHTSLVNAKHHRSTRIRGSLKILILVETGKKAREQLVREGEILFPLKHDSLPQVRNLMLNHHPPYLEFERLSGERLDLVLNKRRTLFVSEAVEILEQLFDVICYLHKQDIFHMAIRPENLIVRPDGGITLIGFSDAIEGGSGRSTNMTTLPYVCPEWPHVTDLASVDCYAAGALLYQMLTGEHPFSAPRTGNAITTALILNEKGRTPFLDPGPRYKEDLRALVRHLTAREPAGRLGNSQTALDRLRLLESGYAAERT